MEAREATTIFYYPAPNPTPASDKPPVTVTVTQTVAPSVTERSTITFGTPWTTATPSLFTPGWNPNGPVHAYIRPQPTIYWCPPAPRVGGRIAGAYFGGLATGLVIAAVMLVAAVMKKKAKQRKNAARVALEEEVTFDKTLLETPKGKGIQLPADDPEAEPFLVGRSEGNQ